MDSQKVDMFMMTNGKYFEGHGDYVYSVVKF